jgi:hypothetical protein|tara:strand:+ start:456 stop:638 length:183 start_codon:yes stop_codon:yes gene_type:complete
MDYAKTLKVVEALDSLTTYVQCREREKNKGNETDWAEVQYYSTLIDEAKETLFDMAKASN